MNNIKAGDYSYKTFLSSVTHLGVKRSAQVSDTTPSFAKFNQNASFAPPLCPFSRR